VFYFVGLSHCTVMPDSSPRERKMTAADVGEEIRLKLEDLLMEGMVVGANVDEMNSLTKLLLAHDQHRLVRLHFIITRFIVISVDC